ncbi:MAG: ankyrin repeat domain-containing protein [Cocleimonas sp.]
MNDDINNPYSINTEPESTNIFNRIGRMGRLRYFFFVVLAIAIPILILKSTAAVIDFNNPYTPLFIIIALYSLIVISLLIFLTIKRCHDFNKPAFYSLSLILPISILAFIFIPGTNGNNQYGSKPLPNSLLLKFAGFTMLAGILAFTFGNKIYQAYNTAQAEKLIAEKAEEKKTAKKKARLVFAIKTRNWDEAEALISANINLEEVEPETKRSPLHLLLSQKGKNIDNKLVPMLIEKGVSCDISDKDGVTPLMLATRYGLKMVKAIVECGPEINAQNNKGDSALHYANLRNNEDMIEYLLESGADEYLKNNAGKTALN